MAWLGRSVEQIIDEGDPGEMTRALDKQLSKLSDSAIDVTSICHGRWNGLHANTFSCRKPECVARMQKIRDVEAELADLKMSYAALLKKFDSLEEDCDADVDRHFFATVHTSWKRER